MYISVYKTVKFKYYVLVTVLYGFVLQNYLQQFKYFTFCKYIDEGIALFFFFAFLYKTAQKRKINYFGFKVIVCFYIIIFCAGISTIMYTYQPAKNIFLDFYANIKFLFTILGAMEFYKQFDFIIYANKLYFHLKTIIIIFAGLTASDLLFGLFSVPNYYFYKNGMKALGLVYGHPAVLSVVCLLLFAILTYLDAYEIKSIHYKVILVLIMILTLRAKIIGTLAIMFLIHIWVKKFNKKITISMLITISPIAVLLARKEIQSYYIVNSQASRSLLTITSFKMAKDMFPFGSGLATFGSAFSLDPYSTIYKIYGLSEVWGISPDTGQDISDTFWPMILGQFGVIALIVYLFFIYCIFKQIQEIRKNNKYFYLACWCLFTYLIIASTSESAFVNGYAVFWAVFLSLFLKTTTLKGSSNEMYNC